VVWRVTDELAKYTIGAGAGVITTIVERLNQRVPPGRVKKELKRQKQRVVRGN
jgi:hypothetical protein